MSRYAGLEIDSRHLRMAIFEGTPKKYALVEYHEVEVAAVSEEERREVIGGTLTDIMSRKVNRGMDVVVGLDSRNAILREIRVPYTKPDLIAKTIKYEAEGYLHSHAIEDLIIEFIKLEETGDSSRLLVCAVEKEIIRGELETLKIAHIDPVAMELDATALATAFTETPFYNGQQNVLMIEIADDYQRFVFLEGDSVVKVRTLWARRSWAAAADRLLTGGDVLPGDGSTEPGKAMGIEDRFKELERSLMAYDEEPGDDDLPIAVVSDEEFARLSGGSVSSSASAGEPASETSAGTALQTRSDDDPLERLFTEIERTFAGYVLSNPIDLVVVTGSRAEELDAVERIAERFEVETLAFELGDLEIQWPGDSGDYTKLHRSGAVACGLALRALGKGLTEFDLRREEFRYERFYDRLMPSLLLASLLLFGGVFLWAMTTYDNFGFSKREYEVLQERSGAIWESFFEEPPPPIVKASPGTAADQARKKIRTIGGGGAARGSSRVVPYLKQLEPFEDFATCLSEARPRVEVEILLFDMRLDIRKGVKSKVKLLVNSNEDVTTLDRALKNSKLFNALLSSDVKDEKVEVDIELTLKDSVLEERGK